MQESWQAVIGEVQVMDWECRAEAIVRYLDFKPTPDLCVASAYFIIHTHTGTLLHSRSLFERA